MLARKIIGTIFLIKLQNKIKGTRWKLEIK